MHRSNTQVDPCLPHRIAEILQRAEGPEPASLDQDEWHRVLTIS